MDVEKRKYMKGFNTLLEYCQKVDKVIQKCFQSACSAIYSSNTKRKRWKIKHWEGNVLQSVILFYFIFIDEQFPDWWSIVLQFK